MKEPTLLDVFAAFVMHAAIVSGLRNVNAQDVYDTAEDMLKESERRHANRN